MEYENEGDAFEVLFSNRATLFLDYVWSEKFHPPPRAILGQWDDTRVHDKRQRKCRSKERRYYCERGKDEIPSDNAEEFHAHYSPKWRPKDLPFKSNGVWRQEEDEKEGRKSSANIEAAQYRKLYINADRKRVAGLFSIQFSSFVRKSGLPN